MLIIQFHTTKIIIIQFHTSTVWRKCLSNNFHTFSKNNRKKLNHFCGFLRTVEQTLNVELILNLFEKNTGHTISIYNTKVFPSNFENLPQKFFCFFFKRKSNFVRKQTFSENFFCMQILIFWVHNVVLDTVMLAFFLFT